MSGKEAALFDTHVATARSSQSEVGRIALLSTPRAGSTWLCHLLARVFDIPFSAVHNPADVDWTRLPGELLLKLHVAEHHK